MRLGAALRRWQALSTVDRRALLAAVTAIGGSTLAVRLLPFRRLHHWLAQWQGSSARTPSRAAAERVRWSVAAASRLVPWRTVCFQQSLAAHLLLRRQGLRSRLHYGATTLPDARGIGAHVWVTVDGQVLVGGDVRGFVRLASYPAETCD